MTPDLLARLRDPDYLRDALVATGHDPDDPRTESALEQALRLGHTGPEHPDDDVPVRHIRRSEHNGERDISIRLPRGPEFLCARPHWGWAESRHGQYDYQVIPCGRCAPCRAWDDHQLARRFDLGRADLQSVVTVTGAVDADEARQWKSQMTRAYRRRFRTVFPRHYDLLAGEGLLTLVTAEPLPAEDTEWLQSYAQADDPRAKRPSLQARVQTCVVRGEEVARWRGEDRTIESQTPGRTRRQLARFHGPWPRIEDGPDDWAYGPTTAIPADQVPHDIEPTMDPEIRASRRRWRAAQTQRERDQCLMLMRAASALAWTGRYTPTTYAGPQAMLDQYAAYRDGRREWEPAWDTLAPWLGDDATGGIRQPATCERCGDAFYPSRSERTCPDHGDPCP